MWAVWVYSRDNRRSLAIRQIGSNVENVVLAMQDGLFTAIMLHLVVVNDSQKATLVVAHYELKLLWKDEDFDWLDDPKEFAPARDEYAYGDNLTRRTMPLGLGFRADSELGSMRRNSFQFLLSRECTESGSMKAAP